MTSNVGAFNRARVFEVIHLFEPISRAEIASNLDLTSAAVSNIVSELLERGVITQLGRRSSARGQPAIELGVQADAAYTVGLHFEHGSVAGIACDLKGAVIEKRRVEFFPLPSPEIVLETLTQIGRELINSVDASKLIGVGLAAVGPIDLDTGSVRHAVDATAWNDVSMREPLSEALGQPVFMDNNATAGAIGEYWYGSGRAYKNFLYAGFYCRGLGGGLFLNKRIYRGSAVNAAEFGHILVNLGSTKSHELPYLENYVSGHALCRDFGDDALETLENRMKDPDKEIDQWFDTASQAFSQAIVSVDHLLDLDTILVGGVFPKIFFTTLMNRVNTRLDALYMHGWKRRSSLQLGEVGWDSAVMGAATLPIYDAFSPGSLTVNTNKRSLRTSSAGGPMH